MNKLVTLLTALFLIPIVCSISIDLYSPSIIPQGETETASFTINSDSLFNGIVYLNYDNIQSSVNSVVILNTSFSGSGPYQYQFTWNTKGINLNNYTISADLKNENNNTLTTDSIQGSVTSSAPIVTSKSPIGFVTSSSITLTITTDEDSICKYGSENVTYESLSNEFEITGETTHTQFLTALKEKTHIYYIRCKDYQGYTMQASEVIEFLVDLPPKAEIMLSEESPLKAGVVEVTVETSKDLEEAPTLEYSFDNNPTSKRPVSLTGSGSYWEGYIIITEDYDKLVGTFYFSGKGKLGNFGTIITKGKTFVVDTTNPPAPISLEAITKNDGKIELNWYYDGEKISHFKIYRSISSGVDYVDFYAQTSNNTQYIDSSTEDKVTYYYRMNVVDEAGNIGPLSDEVYATAIKEGSEKEIETEAREETPKVLPPNLVIKVNDEIKRAEKLLIDIEEIHSNFEKENEEMISSLGLKEEIKSAESRLESLKEELETLKLNYKTETELDSELNRVRLEVKKIEQTTPKEVDLIEKSNSIQSLGQNSIDIAIEKLFLNSDFSNIDKDRYKLQNNRIQSNIEVTVAIYLLELEFMDGNKKDQTLIVKSVTHRSPEPLQDIILFEIIPKEIAESLNELDFLTKDYEIVEEDPIVKFGFSQLDFNGAEIKYKINKKISTTKAKKTVSVPLSGPVQLEQNLNKITGFSIAPISGYTSLGETLGFSKKGLFFVLFGVLIIGILLGYQVLISKGYDLPNFQLIKKIKNRKYGNLNQSSWKYKTSPPNQPKSEVHVIEELISRTGELLSDDQAEKAKSLYPQIEFLYRRLSKEEKPKIFIKCKDLQRRINQK